MTGDRGLRERKKQATRAALGAAALRLAARHGLAHVTVDQIAAEAHVAVRTFRNYFSGKEEAAVSTAEVGAAALVALFRARPTDEPVSHALRAAVFALVDDGAMTAPEHIAVLRLIRATPSLNPARLAVLARQEAALAAAIDERTDTGGRGTDDGVGVRAAAAVLAVLRVVLDRWLDDPATADGAPPPVELLRAELDAALHDLAVGLDAATAPHG